MAKSALLVGALILSVSPTMWLVETWLDPSYASQGGGFFIATVVLFLYAFSSPLKGALPKHRQALVIISVTACIRLSSEILAINMLGALVLAADVYALALLAGLQYRVRSVSPFWLASSFLFCLPLERIVQRLLGYRLQELSADSACSVLSLLFADVQCAGIRITVEGADVLIDLPCSGARAVLLFLFGFTLIAALVRPNWQMACMGGGFALGAAYLANVLRIVLLSSGIALTPDVMAVDVMAQPWHDVIGLVSIAAASPIILMWAVRIKCENSTRPAILRTQSTYRPHPVFAVCFLGLCLAAVNVPSRPLDAGAPLPPPQLPHVLAGEWGSALPLSSKEQDYFVQYGGGAARAAYGEMGLLVTTTRSPLRHLHMPDDCLRGAGFEVDYKGLRFDPFPTAVYLATDKSGARYQVAVSFKASDGFMTANVAEAVWYWLQNRQTSWTAVQRFTPAAKVQGSAIDFEAAVAAAFDLSTSPIHQSGEFHVANQF